MAYNDDQREFPLPAGKPQKRRSEAHLPRYFRTQSNSKFLTSTIDQLLQPGVAEKLSGYVGRKASKAYNANDTYVGDVSQQREDYQLEPALLIKDDLGNVEFYKDYNDFVNQIESFQGNVNDHSLLNSQEYYAWDPHLDWDKLTNFREYYWLPNGPQSVPVVGQTQDIESTYTVELLDNLDNYAYLFSPDGLTSNPSIKLYRGITYRFEINAPGFPFSIRSQRSLDNEYLLEGIEQNVEEGVIEFTPGAETPDVLYYVADNDINAGGLIKVANIEEATFIDVETEILGKKNYTTSAGFNLSNGMKVYFQGDVVPAKYATGEWYVEGVGDKIELVSETSLDVPSSFTEDISVEFDAQGFDRLPFDEAIGYAADKDYIVINRASKDGNLWSRYNRWFHRSVIEESARINNQPVSIDQSARATRPIIEFEAGLKLNQFGTFNKQDVDLIDDFTIDAFSNIEGSLGYNIDGIDLVDGMRVLFTADEDVLVNGKIFEVKFINFASGRETNRQISLVEVSDTNPLENETVLITNGTVNKGKIFYYDGTNWNVAQDKTNINQAPLFDLFDEDGNSFGNKTIYDASTFIGNKVFSYKEGTGVVDSELGFSLSYRSIENIGDITFNYNLLNESFNYQIENDLYTKNTDVGFLRKYSARETFNYVNGWQKAQTASEQPVIRQYVNDNTLVRFTIDVYDESSLLTDLWVRVYVNNKLQFEGTDYEIISSVNNEAEVNFLYDLNIGDNIIIKTKSSAIKNDNGYYEIAPSLEKNPLNDNLNEFTLGEVNDHVNTIVEQLDTFSGVYPGVSNLRDISNLSSYGKKFLRHSSPFNLAAYHITDKDSNVIKSLRYARREYGKFKRVFLQKAYDLGFEGPVKQHVDKILAEINKDKTSSMPFYFSDMVPHGAAKQNTFIVDDDQQTFFALSEIFDINAPGRKAVQVYLNSVQLTYGIDYTFNDDGFCVITASKQRNDVVDIYEYESTNGSFVPPTPTKLGLYPKFVPTIYTDTTYLTPTSVIQGHDGSIVVAYGDYRDELILELERRIYNNIKVNYDTTLLDIHDYKGSEFRNTKFNKSTVDRPMLADFVQWLQLVDEDYSDNSFYTRTNSFTWNYSLMTSPSGENLPGFWRAVYKQAFDTDRPHTHPWEMLGFTIKPTWWEEQYGPSPYTRDNLVMWEDLEKGIIREPNQKFRIDKKYVRSGLTTFIPVDDQGNLLSPSDSGYAKNFITTGIDERFVFGDEAPVESAWRRSSEYPFALITSWVINQPHKVFATGFDRIRQKRNLAGDIIYTETGNYYRLKDTVFPNTIEDSNQVFTSGVVNYIANYFASNITTPFEQYKEKLVKIKNQLGFKLGGFTDKEKFRLILDSRTPLNEGNVFVPDENYEIILNTSSPIKTISYSGVLIEKQTSGFVVRGYDSTAPSFKYYAAIALDNDPVINVGGISEPYVLWESNKLYTVGKNVELEGSYYRCTEQHTSGPDFDSAKFARLPSLPLVGGRDAIFRRKFFEKEVSELLYGTELKTIQEVVDFLLGYQKYLESEGFVFDYYNKDEEVVSDWSTSAKEFMFWTLQNWGVGSVITLSPAAFQLKLQTEYSVVDNIFDSFYGYTLLKADGKKLVEEFTSLGRQNPNEFILKPKGTTADGIFAVKLPLVQKEHVIILDNRTVFGDVIYDLEPGYRQERINVLGYRTDEWDGSLNIPGFIYDRATVSEWEQWKDYSIGDVVKYKEFYYSANNKVPGDSVFDENLWNRLPEKPESGLIPNFEYRVNQFADFYDLDSDNFDTEQQRLAQHLIGYQKRQYLENIINDDVSQYKFYQGYIADKGTRNALTKLFDALSSADKDSLEFYEEWAIKSGQYGAAEGFDEVEFLLDEANFRLAPQPIELVERIDEEATDLVYRIRPYEVYLKPRDYDHTPFPTKYIFEGYTKNSGYVNREDVNFVAGTYDSILTITFADFEKGQYVWVGNENLSWNIYKHVDTDYKVISITPGSGEFTIELTTTPDLSVGEIIGVYDIEGIEGFYKVKETTFNSIVLESEETVTEITDAQGLITQLISVRVPNLTEANKVVEQQKDIVWIDDDDSGEWKVLKNQEAFDLSQTIANNRTGTGHNFASVIAAGGRNTVLAVGAPDDEDGKVHIYTRASESNNLQLRQTLEPESNICDSGQRFGASVSITEDGNYLIVGSPAASNVKTNFKGDWVRTSDYLENDIVRLNEVLWQAARNIEGAEANIIFSSFDSITQILESLDLVDEADIDIPTILTGDYPFTNITTDHLLIRAPKDMYDGSGIGDTVKLAWNELTYSNQSQTSLESRDPFDGNVPFITKSFLESGLVITDKIDAVLYVDASSNAPIVGDTVATQTGFATVAYIYADGASLTIYLKNINGVFDLNDSLFIQNSDFIGEYERVAPTEQIDTESDLGGFWFIETSDYSITSTNSDLGKGLIFKDIVPAGDADPNRYYYNILDLNNEVVSSENSKNSYIRVLSYQGLPGAGGSVNPFETNLYVVRAPKTLTDTLSATDTFDLYVNPLARYSDGSVLSPEDIGLTYTDTNKTQTVYDLWDGYINFVFTKFDTNGEPFEPRVGDTVRDVTTGATAEVTYYQRNLNEVNIFVKNVNGTWSQGDDYGNNAEIEFLATPGDPDPIYQADRIMGQIQFRSLGLDSEDIGKLIVLEASSTIPVPTQAILENAEYWFYNEGTVAGIARAANVPSTENNDWNEVFNLPVASTGTATGNTNEGYYTVFAKEGQSYNIVGSFTVPDSTDDLQLGWQISTAQNGELYKGFVHAKGDGTINLPGKIYFLKNGFDGELSYGWELAKDKRFKGQFETTVDYFENDIVYYNNTLQQAQTNIAAGSFVSSDWTELDSLVDYVGYVPNDTDRIIGEDSSTVIDRNRVVEFASSFDVSQNGEVLVAIVKHDNSFGTHIPNKVVVYRSFNHQYILSQEIYAPDINTGYGTDVSISDDGMLIAVGTPLDDQVDVDSGKVYIYKQVNGTFTLSQTLDSPSTEPAEMFGSSIQFDGNTLVVASRNGDMSIPTPFTDDTTFDNEFTTFYEGRVKDSGTAYVYERINNSVLFAQKLLFENLNIREFGRNVVAVENHIYIGMPKLNVSGSYIGTFVNYRKPQSTNLWNVLRESKPVVDVNKIKRIALYDTKTNELLQYLDYIDPIQGKIAGPAEQEIRYKTYYDPATYTVGTDAVNVKATESWGAEQVGQVWWDLTNAKFINPYQGNIIFSTNNWNQLFESNTIDVYEWVESTRLPSEWDAIADTNEGLRIGISGQSKYGDAVYVQKRVYDSVAGNFSNRYFFWVKNKVNIPDIESRSLSIKDVANLITDPAAQAYRFVALISDNSFVIYNCDNLIKGNDVALSIQYWTIENQNINIHNQYKLVSDGLETSRINRDIEQKWFDSLVGYDQYVRPVPDPNLSPKERYGTLSRPRQGWFVNRTEALKQFVERVNSVFEQNLIVESKNITALLDRDPEPTESSRLYDTVVDTYADLEFIGVAKAERAVIEPVIENGKIVRVNIVNPGRGYRVVPTYTIAGKGEDAEIEFTIDSVGKITSATVIEQGNNYAPETQILVRRFTALVLNDETIQGKWALYERLTETREWSRIESQAYDVSLFWDYTDWYATGYNEFTEIDYLIDESYQLTALDDSIGDVIKISNIGSGGWLLLEKVGSEDSVDYTINYKTIGRQDGTIQLKSTLYDLESSAVGFDSFSFDVKFYDSQPITETRTILETIRDELFIEELAIEYNKLFFASLRYVFSEQNYVDWAFKTSFVKAKHNVGELRQDITFNNDNLASYEDYLKEVKPYKTKLREYLSSYEKLENSENSVTDFDLAPRYVERYGRILPESVKTSENGLIGVDSDLDTYPNKHWVDNLGYELTAIEVADGGTGWTSVPQVIITGGGGTGATAKAYIGQGKITAIEVINPGSGYLRAPTITLEGSQTDEGTSAKVSPILGNGLTRGMHTVVKFDRVSGTFFITDLSSAETFAGNAKQLKFTLKWPMDLRLNTVSVLINNREALRSEFTISNEKDTSKGYDRYFGSVEFTDPPADGASIVINYKKDVSLLQAQDRVNLFYDPQTGQLANDLGQLMDGIDYGGVEVKSFEFGGSAGWDSDPWYTSSWDTYDNTFNDEIFTLDGSTSVLELSTALESGVVYNIYRNNVRIDDPLFGTGNETNPNALMPSITGDGTQTSIAIADYDIPANDGDVFVVRKITSDGSFLPDPNSFDTIVEGGNLAYSTATGLNAIDINIDGDGFVTPTTSKGPEEVVPGQVLDTLDITVYERPTTGASQITCRNYIGDGSTKIFAIGASPFKAENLFVKVDYDVIDSSLYTIDYQNKTVEFETAPIAGSDITLINLGISGTSILEVDQFTGDGSTVNFLTNIRYKDDINYIATIDGVEQPSVIIESDDTYEYPENVVISFATAPEEGSTIRFALFEGEIQSYSEVNIDTFVADGSTTTFELSQTPFTRAPNAFQVLVKVNDKILNAGYNQEFTVSTTREYQLDLWQIPIASIDNTDVKVYLNDTELEFLQEWSFEGAGAYNASADPQTQAGSTVILANGIGSAGDTLRVFVVTDGEYTLDGTTLTLNDPQNDNDIVEVYQFSNHDSQNIERQSYDVVVRTPLTVGSEEYFNYHHITNGLLELRYPAVDAQYVWVVLNGNMLSPSVDYILTPNQRYIKLLNPLNDDDVIELIHFSNTPVVNKFGWRQFEDMLNRTHYKRLDGEQNYILSKNLNWYDKTIELNTTEGLPEPNSSSKVPGVIFVDGERIEYWRKDGNFLKQLRRGTLGTGVKEVYNVGTEIYNQSAENSLPYKDETITTIFNGDGTTANFELDFTPNSVNEFEVFVAGRRLRKNSISSYKFTNPTDQDSPENDETLAAEFSVEGSTLTLTTPPGENQNVIVVRRIGKIWTNPGTPLSSSESDIAKFLRAKSVDLPR